VLAILTLLVLGEVVSHVQRERRVIPKAMSITVISRKDTTGRALAIKIQPYVLLVPFAMEMEASTIVRRIATALQELPHRIIVVKGQMTSVQ
ncbi:hypothetical protein HDU99_007575, partial [Rhizoclosmatium hyalinum]